MARRLMAAILVVCVVETTSAQTLRESIDRAARDAAAQSPAGSGGRIPPGLLWTGISLLGAGGAFLVGGFATDENDQTCVSNNDFDETCLSDRKVLLGSGAVMAGVGGALLAIGVSKRSSVGTTVTLRRGGFTVRHNVALPRWMQPKRK